LGQKKTKKTKKSVESINSTDFISELLSRYNGQAIILENGEKLQKLTKPAKEDALSGIQHKLYGTSDPLSYAETLKITQEL
jgi:hypothetical protein